MAEPASLCVLSLDHGRDTLARLSEILSAEERERAGRFHFERDRHEWIAARAGLRLLLAERTGCAPAQIVFAVSRGGKPSLPGSLVHFNLSHSGGRAAVVLSEAGPVGVDLEPWSRAPGLEECLETFCHPNERQKWMELKTPEQKQRYLLRTWCAKEAYLKALGSGLVSAPSELEVRPTNEGIFLATSAGSDRSVRLHFPMADQNFLVAVALPASLPSPAVFTRELSALYRLQS